MAGYITSKDSEHAQIMSIRWESCSEAARKFAAFNVGKYDILPHVIAEAYDKDPIGMTLAALGENGKFEESEDG
jgi:hypothetical protein